MIAKLEKADLPVPRETVISALQLVAKQIHERYRSLFTLVFVLPQSVEYYKLLAPILKEELVLHLPTGIGAHLVDRGDKPGVSIISPPSSYAIRGRKVVVFDAFASWPINYVVCEHLRQLRPQSIEVAALFSLGEAPTWANPDYLGFEVPVDTLAKDVVLL